MLIDIIFAVFLLLAVMRGYRQGLIIGLFSLLSIIIGLAAAMKLSAVVAGWLGNSVNVSKEWLPLISFILVFFVVVLLIRMGAKAIESAVEVVLMGWINKIAGILLYAVIGLLVFSVLLFYAEQMQLIQPATIRESVSYPLVQPWGPRVINGIGSVIPVFKDMFSELEEFFGNVSRKISMY
ncbi:MAG TPA: CvpA family protein [Chitinophagaceae bacterium]|jgi:membrane protein required for colicin V production|nr:CvpA family protein [Chitinophagaceae bacterium]HRG91908.1 CvpA family protein [Chitinophagaceae bacterium]